MRICHSTALTQRNSDEISAAIPVAHAVHQHDRALRRIEVGLQDERALPVTATDLDQVRYRGHPPSAVLGRAEEGCETARDPLLPIRLARLQKCLVRLASALPSPQDWRIGA